MPQTPQIKTLVTTKIELKTVPIQFITYQKIPVYKGRNGKQLINYTATVITQLGQCHAQLETIKYWNKNG